MPRNMERHLYLLSQVLELGLPTVVAVNMLDVAASLGIKLGTAAPAEKSLPRRARGSHSSESQAKALPR